MADTASDSAPAWGGFRIEIEGIKESIRSLNATVKELAVARQITPQTIAYVLGGLGAFILLYTQPIGRNVDALAAAMEKHADRMSVVLEKQADRQSSAVTAVNERVTLAIDASRRERAEETRYGRAERIAAIAEARADYESKIKDVNERIQAIWTQIVPRSESDRTWTDRRLADEAVQRQIAEIQAQIRGFGNAGDLIRMTITDIKRIEEQVAAIRSWQPTIEKRQN